MDYAVAVLDIGKTNKKVLIYDDSLNQVDAVYRSIETVPYNGLHAENTAEAELWFLEMLKDMGQKYPIKAISVSTHGATCALVDDQGELTLPVLAYTNEADEKLHDDFYREMGSPDALQVSTGTAQVKPLINLAKLIYFQKQKFSEEFARAESILFYPQYFGYRLTGQKAVDYTFLGCHTYLWDFENQDWSHICKKMGISEMLPAKVRRPGEILGTITEDIARRTGLSEETLVTVGIHDSNSSLLPYLIKGEKNFVLNSTGTWCVAMHPTDSYGFKDDELGKTVFYNISAREDLVKTAIFMGGLEFGAYKKYIRKAGGSDGPVGYDRKVIQKILDQRKDFIIPGIVKGAGQFPDSEARVLSGKEIHPISDLENDRFPEFFTDEAYAFGVLDLSLAIQSKVALDRIKIPEGTTIYVEGGFRKDKTYLTLLAALYPESRIYTTDISEATSLGAAMLGKAALDDIPLEDLKGLVEIEMNHTEAEAFDGLTEYVDQFLSYV